MFFIMLQHLITVNLFELVIWDSDNWGLSKSRTKYIVKVL